MRFCTQCGSALEVEGVPRPPPAPSTERRLVSVLFADLVGFTAASEGRDAEETRELLSRYFDLARTIIERYGGTVEKFIGDAVMAVWGAPTAHEDDAERAVRAALELVDAVPGLEPSVQARASVLTGEAAVNLRTTGDAMVAGDLVNTASRVQALARPSTVLVGEATRHASEAAIAYEAAGEHELKGRSRPLPLHRALRVVAAVGGALRAPGLEPPFVGRERELRLIKELFHACAEEQTAHLVSVVGGAGNGKSRLTWEFYKYVDGLADVIRWHRGRCLPYGEGVTYWALAEMVRMRVGLAEVEDIGPARAKLRASVAEYVVDADERAWVEPRLAHLLGLEERQVHERESLFAGWRRFFERIAEREPVVLVFDDVHWADPSLLDFVEYLLEWSRHHAIFVVALARPELVERHPEWGAGTRNFTSLALEPLPKAAMETLLAGLVPGLPAELRGRILGRAEGVPLYAVETVRMLLDRGLVRREADAYLPVGSIGTLDVPETLHALVAARLDGLDPDERRLIQDAAIVGRTFTTEALAAVSGIAHDALDRLLASLARKELLSVQADPRSPEHGQYGFVQDLLKHVAYETLARRERKRRHLAVAAYLEATSGSGDPDVVEVVAAHYLDAYKAAPSDDDAADIRAKAQETLTRAGERAASLAANEEAGRYFAQAAELAGEPLAEAALRERAGEVAVAAGAIAGAQEQYRQAIALLEEQGEAHQAARVLARLGWVEWQLGQLGAAIERMECAFAVLSADEPDADFAVLVAELGRLHFFDDNLDRSAELLEIALTLGESLLLPEVLAMALLTNGVIASWRGRHELGFALATHALRLALEHDLPTVALRAYNNIADGLDMRDRYDEALDYHQRGLEYSRRVGNRQWEWQFLIESCYPLALTGRWDEALAQIVEVPDEVVLLLPPQAPVEIEIARGRPEEARRLLDAFSPRLEASADAQQRAIYGCQLAAVVRAEGRLEEALSIAERVLDQRHLLSVSHVAVKPAFVEAVEAALALGRLDRAEELVSAVEALRPGEIPPLLRAHCRRFRARLAAAREGDPEPGFKGGAAIFREYGVPFWLAVTQLEHAEWLLAEGHEGDAAELLEEAVETFERLEAAPWLQRLDAARTKVGAAA